MNACCGTPSRNGPSSARRSPRAGSALILRKGGIAEAGGAFRLEHDRFWLYPTYVHQQRAGIKPEAAAAAGAGRGRPPPAGVVRLTHFAEVAGVYHVHDLAGGAAARRPARAGRRRRCDQRFAYRTPGLFVLPVRVYRAADARSSCPRRPEYAGCKSWVELGGRCRPRGDAGARRRGLYARVRREIAQRLS